MSGIDEGDPRFVEGVGDFSGERKRGSECKWGSGANPFGYDARKAERTRGRLGNEIPTKAVLEILRNTGVGIIKEGMALTRDKAPILGFSLSPSLLLFVHRFFSSG